MNPLEKGKTKHIYSQEEAEDLNKKVYELDSEIRKKNETNKAVFT